MKIIPFHPDHVNELEPPGQSSDVIRLFKSKAGELGRLGPCFTGIYKGKIIGCAGIVELWPGVGMAWTFLKPGFPALSVHRAIKNGLANIMKSCGYHRIQASVTIDFEAGNTWLKRLGFESEGVMTQYGPNKEDFVQYARVI